MRRGPDSCEEAPVRAEIQVADAVEVNISATVAEDDRLGNVSGVGQVPQPNVLVADGEQVPARGERQVSVAKLSVVFALKTRSCAIGLCGC
ncbi:MAG TPA: hypothetical protein VIU87_09875 [Mycobacterium sp.]